MTAYDINDLGQIACSAQHIQSGQIRALRLDPISIAISGDIDGHQHVNASDLLAVIAAWGPCTAPPAACNADIAPTPNGDGEVNVIDLLMVIINWG